MEKWFLTQNGNSGANIGAVTSSAYLGNYLSELICNEKDERNEKKKVTFWNNFLTTMKFNCLNKFLVKSDYEEYGSE